MPDDPIDALDTLRLLDELGGPATMATAGPRYFGFVNGAPLPVALAASWTINTWDQNATLPVMPPVAARLHAVARDCSSNCWGCRVGRGRRRSGTADRGY